MRAVVQRVTQANVSVRTKLELPIPPTPPLNGEGGHSPKELELTDISNKNALETTGNASHSPQEGMEVIPVASTQIVQEVVGEIGAGLVILLGVGRDDTDSDVSYLVDRTVNLRIFPDANDQMNLSLLDVEGEVLVVSQFTLYGDARKGRRPSFFEAMDPTAANGLYLSFCENLKKQGVTVATGRFGANMQLSLINDGPVTILLDSKKGF